MSDEDARFRSERARDELLAAIANSVSLIMEETARRLSGEPVDRRLWAKFSEMQGVLQARVEILTDERKGLRRP